MNSAHLLYTEVARHSSDVSSISLSFEHNCILLERPAGELDHSLLPDIASRTQVKRSDVYALRQHRHVTYEDLDGQKLS